MKQLLSIRFEQAPLSVNHLYGQRGRIRFLTKVGREYKEALGKIAKSCMTGRPSPSSLVMEIVYYFGDMRRRDVTNYDKPILDAFTGIVYKDDCQLDDVHLHKRVDKDHPRTEIKVWVKSEADHSEV